MGRGTPVSPADYLAHATAIAAAKTREELRSAFPANTESIQAAPVARPTIVIIMGNMNECFGGNSKLKGEPASGAEDRRNLILKMKRAPYAAVQLGGSGALWGLAKADDVMNFDFLTKRRIV